ncbi:MAG TPA: Flp pilus assembly protein CpaB [Candidatus Limnocylindrales bacterium]|nr:Flp pilus assembly protein CpaB [Candidatus Limnocylindrales bacterium]
MRRTSRLVLLLGVFLAALVFVVVLLGGKPTTGPDSGVAATPPPPVIVLTAASDIPLGTIVTAEMFSTKTLAPNLVEANAYGDASQAIGKTTRKAILTGQQVHSSDFQNRAVPITVPQGRRAVAIAVNQLTGVGNLLDVGDTIDMVISLRGDAFPVVQVLADGSVTVVSGINPLSIKLPLLLQDVQIIGTIDPPPPAAPAAAQGQPAPSVAPGVALDQQKLLVLAVTPQQAEVILFARTTGGLDAILRSPLDAGTTVETTGVILKTLVDTYGILPPEIVQVPIPTPLP